MLTLSPSHFLLPWDHSFLVEDLWDREISPCACTPIYIWNWKNGDNTGKGAGRKGAYVNCLWGAYLRKRFFFIFLIRLRIWSVVQFSSVPLLCQCQWHKRQTLKITRVACCLSSSWHLPTSILVVWIVSSSFSSVPSMFPRGYCSTHSLFARVKREKSSEVSFSWTHFRTWPNSWGVHLRTVFW